jgi:hypothetical protein
MVVARVEEIPFLPWPERRREAQARCLFVGSEAVCDAVAARLVLATAAQLPEVSFDIAGPVSQTLTPPPPNVSVHPFARPELLNSARIALCPTVAGNDARPALDFARAGVPTIVSPHLTHPSLADLSECWLVCSPEPHRLRDAIVESFEWDWSEAVQRAFRFARA